MMPVPDRLKNGVGKAKDEHILNGFLGQIMVNAKNLFFLEGGVQDLVKLQGTFQVTTKRFFNHDSGPAVLAVSFFCKICPAQEVGDNRV